MFSSLLSSVAGALLGTAFEKGAEYLKTTDMYSNFASSSIGQGLTSAGNFLGIDSSDVGDFFGKVAENYSAGADLKLEDLPAAASLSTATSLAAGRMQGAGQAAQIPLGSGNRIPNMLQKPGVRAALQRVQTVPIPRSNIQASASTINLSSAKVSSRYRRKAR